MIYSLGRDMTGHTIRLLTMVLERLVRSPTVAGRGPLVAGHMGRVLYNCTIVTSGGEPGHQQTLWLQSDQYIAGLGGYLDDIRIVDCSHNNITICINNEGRSISLNHFLY